MKVFLNEINYKSMVATESEIKFGIAEAKVSKSDVCITILKNEEYYELFSKCLKKSLSALKKKGIISFFVFSEEFKDKQKLETAYLVNKHPDIENYIPKENKFVIIKV